MAEKFNLKKYQEIYARVGSLPTNMDLAIVGRVASTVYSQHVSKEAVHCKFLSEEGCCQKNPIGIGCHPGTTVCEAHPLDKCITKI